MKALAEQIQELNAVEVYGRVVAVRGLMVEIAGPIEAMPVGARVNIETEIEPIACEVVGFTGRNALLMPFAALDGVRRGCRAVVAGAGAVRPSLGWLGRVVNAMGQPIDGKGPLPPGPAPYPFRNQPPPAHARRRLGPPLDLGVRAINTFLTCCRGQRMGIFSGSGVGKSVLLGMLARNVRADVSVVGLIGERGREVQDFLQDDLGPEGLARSVVVVSTSNEPPLMRRQAGYLTLAIAEYFRDAGKDVLLLVDSITRFAAAQREIGLSVGEPPTAKGYTPTVFSELPQLLERAGPGTHEGTITALGTRRISLQAAEATWVYPDAWYVIGPFENPGRRNINQQFLPESLVDLDAEYEGKNGQKLRWQYWKLRKPRIVPHPNPGNYEIYYGYTELWFEKEMALWVVLGSDDHGKLWVNDELVWSSALEAKAFKEDEQFQLVKFKAGYNRLLFRLENAGGLMGYSLMINTTPMTE